ncbi:MAG TPA: YlbF family regulator [Oscillospiraceae bacterium]|nr:YlbF family regulator [Oscillospiraceae bacterium]
MDIITMAREMGKEIQKDERYLNWQIARQNSDADEELQNLIGEFNLKRMAINNEVSKEDRNEETVKSLNEELRHVYAQIMQNPNMTAYNEAKDQIDALLQRISAIITQSAEGEDPETADYQEHSCGGECSSCGGCH